MKTAEEWDKLDEFRDIYTEDLLPIIKQIQLDAYKAGMSEATEITLLTSNNLTHDEIASLILSARDNKTTL